MKNLVWASSKPKGPKVGTQLSETAALILTFSLRQLLAGVRLRQLFQVIATAGDKVAAERSPAGAGAMDEQVKGVLGHGWPPARLEST